MRAGRAVAVSVIGPKSAVCRLWAGWLVTTTPRHDDDDDVMPHVPCENSYEEEEVVERTDRPTKELCVRRRSEEESGFN